mmetsp:Transcript_4292/g.6804  ORF Transcript_4292/g.6804 Transcript_4292/m.6804 type:complete len:558 (+) Transcript_4292:1-1674(+)
MLATLELVKKHATDMQKLRMSHEQHVASNLAMAETDLRNKFAQATRLVSEMPTADMMHYEVDQQTARTANMHRKMTELEESCAKLTQERNILKEQVPQLERMLQEERERALREKEQLESQLRSSQAQAEESTRRNRELEAMNLKLQQEATQSAARVEVLTGEVAEAKRTRDEAVRKYDRAKEDAAQAKFALDDANSKLKMTQEDLERKTKECRENLERAEQQAAELRQWAKVAHFLEGPPAISPGDFADFLRGSGLTIDEMSSLFGVLRGPPREHVDHVVEVTRYLRGPPIMTFARIKQAMEAEPRYLAKEREFDEKVWQLKDEASEERHMRHRAEKDSVQARNLADAAHRAMEDWKPMIEYMQGPPSVHALVMGETMTKTRARPDEMLDLMKILAGPPVVNVKDVISIIKTLWTEDGMSVDNVQTLWTKLSAIQGARWRQEHLKIGFDSMLATNKVTGTNTKANAMVSSQPVGAALASAIQPGSQTRALPGASESREVDGSELPEHRYMDAMAKNQMSMTTAKYMTQYEPQRRLKELLKSHDNYKSVSGHGAADSS